MPFPYGNQDLSMIVLLPNRVDGLAELETSLSVSNVSKWLTALSPQPIKVFLPKFRLTEQFALAGVLKSMGMATAFDITAADFLGVTDPGASTGTALTCERLLHGCDLLPAADKSKKDPGEHRQPAQDQSALRFQRISPFHTAFGRRLGPGIALGGIPSGIESLL
jgi:hypothetical protein